MVSALILKELKGLSYDELMDSVLFDLRFKAALGLINIDDVPFSRATLFNFQNRLLEYEKKTGINLFETVFDNLSAKQIKELSIKADIQRTDSTLISSNIKKYSRVQLLIEVLLRLYRILDDLDKTAVKGLLQSYLKRGSEKYVYKLKSSELTHELTLLGEAYHSIFQLIDNNNKKHYSKTKEYVNFNRVYQEHFVIVNQEITVKPTDELNSGMLQSPDDQEATFRKKRDKQSKGFTINATETANHENPLQLLDDIVVSPNNIDDTKILAKYYFEVLILLFNFVKSAEGG